MSYGFELKYNIIRVLKSRSRHFIKFLKLLNLEDIIIMSLEMLILGHQMSMVIHIKLICCTVILIKIYCHFKYS